MGSLIALDPAATVLSALITGHANVSISEFNTTNEPALNGYIEVGQTLYYFNAEAITGWSGISNGTEVYMRCVPGTSPAITVEFTTTAPVWSSAKRGWYESGTNKRYIGGCYKDVVGDYTRKWLYQQSQANNDTHRFYGDGLLEVDKIIVAVVPWEFGFLKFQQSIATQNTAPQGIAWKPDGTKLYEVGADGVLIYESNVSTPWDISTAVFYQSIAAQDTFPTGIAWKPDGTKLYEVGSSDRLIYESDVSTPWDISTAVFSQSIATQDTFPTGIAWKSDGTKLYEAGANSDLIYESAPLLGSR